MEVTLGNVLSWIVMIGTAGIVYGTLSGEVEQHTVDNARQDIAIASLQNAMSDARVRVAEMQGDLRIALQLLHKELGNGRAGGSSIPYGSNMR